MIGIRQNLRVIRILPALLLAVLIATQVERFGHVHAVDDPVSECSQCRSYGGQAGLAVNTFPLFFSATGAIPDSVPVRATLAAHYRLNARGPPIIS